MGDKKLVDTMIKDGLWDAYNNYHMGTTAENINDIWGITREELDAFAAASQQKTEAAQAAGKFDDEIVPVMVKVKKEMVEFKRGRVSQGGRDHGEHRQAARRVPRRPRGRRGPRLSTPSRPPSVQEADRQGHVSA